MEKVDRRSLDIVAENVAKLKTIFPDIFSERRIDREALEALLGEYIDREDERYSFIWHGKSRARRIAQTSSTGTLRPAPEEPKNWESTQNLYLEGDNLEVLKLLQKSYHKRIKMIYIDPPYNTGKDFVYKDNFKGNIKNYLAQTGQLDSEGNKLSTNSDTSGRYHSNWLNMIYPRLKLARNLLRDDGVIFISIDDNEVANLRKVCDEIFGEENFVAEIVWQKRTSPDARYNLGAAHDYILVYSKTQNTSGIFNKLPLPDERRQEYKNPDNDPRGDWASVDMTGQIGHATSSQFYKIKTPYGIAYSPPEGRCWAFSESTVLKLIDEGRIWFGKDGKSRPRLKKYLSEMDGVNAWTWWSNEKVGHNQEATKELKSLLGGGGELFTNPKPVSLLERVLRLSTDKNDIVLDFFSGSATTAHAVMQLNAEDGGKRRYIMVQLPESTDEKSEAYKAGYRTIADIGKERIRRAGEKIKAENADKKEIDKLDIGFKVFKLDSSNIKAWDPDVDNLEASLLESVDNIKPDRTQADLLYEILPKYGLDLTVPIQELDLAGKKVHIIGPGSLVVCLDEEITLEVVEEIARLKDRYDADESMQVVFRDGGFKDAEVKTTLCRYSSRLGLRM